MALNYSSFAQAFNNALLKNGLTRTANLLLGFLIDGRHSAMGKGRKISRQDARTWFRAEDNISGPVKAGLTQEDAFEEACNQMEDLLEHEVDPEKKTELLDNIWSLTENDVSMSEETKQEISDYFDNEEDSKFLARALLFAVRAENKLHPKPSHKAKSEEALICEVVEKVNRIKPPKQLAIPKNIDTKETEYVNEMLVAFADAENVSSITKDELSSNPDYSKYKDDFDQQRKCFYAAESLRMAERDSESLKGKHGFECLEDEMYDGIYDALMLSDSNALEHMHHVLQHATTINPDTLLAHIDGWVKNKEKRGVCHMLVKDKGIHWKK